MFPDWDAHLPYFGIGVRVLTTAQISSMPAAARELHSDCHGKRGAIRA